MLRGVGEDDLLAALGIEHDLGLFQLRDIIGEAAHGDRVRRMEAVAVGDVADADAIDLESDDHRLLGLRAEHADDRLQRPHPAQRRPAACGLADAAPERIDFGQGKLRMMPGITSAMISSAGRPGLTMMGDVEIALLRVGVDVRLVDR